MDTGIIQNKRQPARHIDHGILMKEKGNYLILINGINRNTS